MNTTFANLSVSFKPLLCILSALSLSAFLWAVPVRAQEAGISISPAVIEEDLDPGTITEYKVRIKNLSDLEQVFSISVQNIKGVRDGGVPIFVDTESEITGYELADWIDLPFDQIRLSSGAVQDFTFTLTVPANTSPGSHFGGILISVDPPDFEANSVSVGYKVANIISIRVTGETDNLASVRQFSTDKFLYGSQLVDFLVRVENAGNVLIRPSGPLDIYNMLGEKVGRVIFNEQQGAVFPKDAREYEISWDGDTFGFGRYEATLSLVYGDEGARKTMSSTATFWIMPLKVIVPALVILPLLLFASYLSVRSYIRRTMTYRNYGEKQILSRRRRSNTLADLLLIAVMLIVTVVFLSALLVLFA